MHHSNRRLWLLCMQAAIILFPYVTLTARSIPTINKEKAHEAAREQVMWNDRVCPLSTPAHEFLQFIYGKSSYKGLSAVQVLYGWHLRPDEWKDEPMILIPDRALRQQLGIEGKYASFAQLFDDTLGFRLNNLRKDLPTQLQQLARESPAAIELDEKAGMIILLTQGRLIAPRPDSIPPMGKFRLEAEILYNETPSFFTFFALFSIFLCIFAAQKKRTNES